MIREKTFLLLFIGIILVVSFIVSNAFADGDDYYENERSEHYERDDDDDGKHRRFFTKRREASKYSGKYFRPADNPVYKEECSSCHFLYLPGLLPSGSWDKVMDSTHDHFGEDLFLEEERLIEIKNFLLAHSADETRSKQSRKILKSLGSDLPLKITDIPYIKREHREIRDSVFKREAVGSLSNCDACHQSASQGDFEEDNVRIPR